MTINQSVYSNTVIRDNNKLVICARGYKVLLRGNV